MVFRLKCQIFQQRRHLAIFFISFKIKPDVTSNGFTTKNRIFTPFWYQYCKNCKVVLPIKIWIWLKYSWNLLMCLGILDSFLAGLVHCWKCFSPRSNFGTKNPKLGSNNPFVMSVNFKNHLDLVCQFLDWQWSKLLDKGFNNRIPNSKYMTIVALIQ